MILLDGRKRHALRELSAWVIGRRSRIRIVGDSMLPTLEAGQYVLVDGETMPTAGELAVAIHPERPSLRVVKRVGSITVEGAFHLLSDNVSAGTDSRTWGPVAGSSISGKVTLLLDRPAADLGPM